MSRIIHFGIVARDGRQAYTEGFVDHIDRHLDRAWFSTDGDSHTDWGETFPQHDSDALHLTHTTDCPSLDGDGTPIRLSADEVADVAQRLIDQLPDSVRLVDYWLEDSADEWGSDVHLHGLWAIASVAGRAL